VRNLATAGAAAMLLPARLLMSMPVWPCIESTPIA
jgi:hypothetical protein